MRKVLKKLVPFILVLSMAFTMGVQTISVEGNISEGSTKQQSEQTTLKEEGKGEMEVLGDPSLKLEVTLEDKSYKNGDTIEYEIKLINDGEVDLKNIKVKEDLNKEFAFEELKVKEEKILERKYKVNEGNNLNEIKNKVEIEVEFNNKSLVYEGEFKVPIIKEESKDPEQVEEKTKEEKNETEDIEEIEEELDEGELDEEEFKEELAENYPDMLGEPKLIFPNINYRKMMLETFELKDTIQVNKTAVRTTDEDGNVCGCRTFEVTLDISGEPQQAPVDVVLAIDRSGSMKEGNVYEYLPIVSAPSTNKSYYVKVDEEYQQVSYRYQTSNWRYYDSEWKYVSWNANGDDDALGGNSSNPLGKPFYERYGRSRMYLAKQAAVNFAAKVLGPSGVPGSRVSIVSYSGPTTTSGTGSIGVQSHASRDQDLTDDISLVNTAIAGLVADGGTNTEAGFIESKAVIEGSISNQNPNSNKVVVMFTDGMPTSSNGNGYGPNDPTSHNNHTVAAYTAGQSIHGVASVFTVGLFEGMAGAVYNLAVDTLTKAQNKGFYNAPTAGALDGIFNDISTQLGYAATNAVVVDKIGDKFELIESSLPAGATYNPATREITWNAGTIITNAQLKYIVQAKLDTPAGIADTNEYANLNYTDIFGNATGPKTFPKPEVDVKALMQIGLTDASIIKGNTIDLGTGIDPNGENYMSPVTGGDAGDDGTYIYQWRIVGDGTIISTDKNPEVSPTEDTEYEVTVTSSTGCVAVATMKVTVKDKETSFGIKKIDKRSESLLNGAKFVLKKDGVEVKSDVTVNGYAWMNDLLPGTYTLEETEAPEGYKSNNQVYEIVIAEDGTITVDPELEIETKDNKQVLVIENELLEFDIRLKKVDGKSKELLDGAEFILKVKEDGVVVGTKTTIGGYIDFDNLFSGTYTLKETVAPNGYKLNDTEYTITIGANGDITVDPELTIEEEDGKKVIVLENQSKTSLPNTGGPGSLIFILLGISLMAFSYFGYIRKYN